MAEGFYEDPRVYDILHASGTADEVDGLERIARLFAPGAGAGIWLEPACGTGRYLRVAARRGRRVLGFDRSPAMVAYARERVGAGRGNRIIVADMGRFAAKLPRADFAFCLINTIRHLESDAAMVRHLREMARALRPGGVYAVGLGTTGYGIEPASEDVWEGRRGGCHVKQIVEYLPPRRRVERFEQVYSHLVITRGTCEEHRDHAYRLRCYDARQWRDVVTRAGMEIIAVTDDRGNAHDPGGFGYAVYILRARSPRVTRPGWSGSGATGSRRPARRR